MEMMMSTTSMGDIAFLLIIFFMLSSNFMKTANVNAEDPASADVETQEPGNVSVVLDATGDVWLQGVKVGVTELASGVKDAVGEHREKPVHVRIDKNLPREKFMPVIEAVSEAGVRVMLTGALPEAPAK